MGVERGEEEDGGCTGIGFGGFSFYSSFLFSSLVLFGEAFVCCEMLRLELRLSWYLSVCPVQVYCLQMGNGRILRDVLSPGNCIFKTRNREETVKEKGKS